MYVLQADSLQTFPGCQTVVGRKTAIEKSADSQASWLRLVIISADISTQATGTPKQVMILSEKTPQKGNVVWRTWEVLRAIIMSWKVGGRRRCDVVKAQVCQKLRPTGWSWEQAGSTLHREVGSCGSWQRYLYTFHGRIWMCWIAWALQAGVWEWVQAAPARCWLCAVPICSSRKRK